MSNRNIPPVDYSDSEDADLEVVQLEALVVMKIIKHCNENLPEFVTGQLLGLDFNATLEVTNCFPFPNRGEDDEEETDASVAEYQIEMMRCLREVNVDSNAVGWYQSTYMSSFVNDSMIESQFNYQMAIKKCVVVIYDPLMTTMGLLSLKAFRLTNLFMHLYRNQSFSHHEIVAKSGLGFNDIFEEIKIEIKNSYLLNACLYELDHSDLWSSSRHSQQSLLSPSSSLPPLTVSNGNTLGPGWFGFDRLDLSTNPFLEKNLEFLIECSDELVNEQTKFQVYQKLLRNQKKSDEEDNPSLKPLPPAPSRLDSLIFANQINNFCHQINDFTAQSVAKLHLLSALTKDQLAEQGQQTTKP